MFNVIQEGIFSNFV